MTAEALMRSRFSAFAVGDEAYLLHSWHPGTRPARVRFVPGQRWTRLEVLAASGGRSTRRAPSSSWPTTTGTVSPVVSTR